MMTMLLLKNFLNFKFYNLFPEWCFTLDRKGTKTLLLHDSFISCYFFCIVFAWNEIIAMNSCVCFILFTLFSFLCVFSLPRKKVLSFLLVFQENRVNHRPLSYSFRYNLFFFFEEQDWLSCDFTVIFHVSLLRVWQKSVGWNDWSDNRDKRKWREA